MVDFSKPPDTFLVGDRVHLKETPEISQTQGTILALDYSAPAPSARVQWDNGQPPELWNTIAIEPLKFRPRVVLEQTYAELSSKPQASGNQSGYQMLRFVTPEGATTLDPVVVVPAALAFHLGCGLLFALECLGVNDRHYHLLSENPGNPHNWVIIQVRLVGVGITHAWERTYFADWKAATDQFQKLLD